MKKLSMYYYGHEFTANLPETINNTQNVSIGQFTVPMPGTTFMNVICLKTFYKFKDWVSENKLILDDRSYRYLCSEIKKLYE